MHGALRITLICRESRITLNRSAEIMGNRDAETLLFRGRCRPPTRSREARSSET